MPFHGPSLIGGKFEFTAAIEGVKQVRRMLRALPRQNRNKVQKKVFRAAADRVYSRVLLNFSGGVVQERTGRTVAAMEAQRVRVRTSRDGNNLEVGVTLPRRPELGIAADDRHYYLMALEYGAPSIGLAELMPIRLAVNHAERSESGRMLRETRVGIQREARRLARNAR